MQYATRHVIFVYILQSRECEGFSFINLVTFFTESNMISGMFFFLLVFLSICKNINASMYLLY
jgi:hypothetical protein